MGSFLRRCLAVVGRIAAIAFGPRGIESRELTLIAGLVLLAIGGFRAWEPAGWLVPGAVLVYVALWSPRHAARQPDARERMVR